jgi:alanyl-tRNA synthetase
MTANEVRQRYLDFFKEKGHAVIPSASLVPENDPSVLFTTAGMHPLVPYLLGEKHPLGVRLVDVQKCIRTGDIDEVGDYCHHTFFEMLGNWSLGDYFKKEVIAWSYEFLTSPKWLGLDKNRLAVSVFKGDNDAPFDEEAFETWKNLGIDEKRIAKLSKKNNWWGPAGETGPCGPDTEMFYWTGDPSQIPETFNDDNPLWLEIWNDVFMQYNKTIGGTFEPLAQKNVDTGMGLERTLAVVNGFDDNYKTELFWPIIEKIENLSHKKYDENLKAMRIIADHLKAATFTLGDEKGIAPSNTGQGYVLRRLIRRAVRYGKQLGIKSFTKEIAEVVIAIYKEVYPELSKNKNFIFNNLSQEEEKFEKTLEHGLKEFEKIVSKVEFSKDPENRMIGASSIERRLSGKEAFNLYQTYGFPIELTLELAGEKKIIVDINGFQKEFEEEMGKHQKLSQTASAGMFKGGLSDAGEENKKLHTATHLLRQALQEILKTEITQKGSNITAERLRFDFTFERKMTDEEKKKVEDLVNEKIAEKLPVQKIIMKKEDAEKTGASHAFGDKYGDEVSVYFIGDSLESAWSKEFCGGPHVTNTGDLGHFKIIKEEASSAGIRRIKAVLDI